MADREHLKIADRSKDQPSLLTVNDLVRLYMGGGVLEHQPRGLETIPCFARLARFLFSSHVNRIRKHYRPVRAGA